MSQGMTQPNIRGGVSIKDGPNIDAFSRLRVSDPTALFAIQCQYDTDPLVMETGATGTGSAGSHSADTRMVALTCTAGSGTSFIQSYEYIPYQAGKSQLVFITGLLNAAVAGAVVDVGLFDASNGIFFRQNGATNLQFVRRTSTSGSIVNNAVNQADWNLDKLDGTGSSGLTLNVATVFILVIDAQFLGMGRVRVGFDIDGEVVYAHEFLNANVLAVPYIQTLSLPVQMLVTATATGGDKTSHFKCAAVASEGGLSDDLGYEFSTPEKTVTAGSGTRTHLLSLRPKTTFNAIANRCRVVPTQVNLLVTGNFPILWELCVGSTFTVAPTYADVNTTYSASEYTSVVGTVNAGGLVIASGYLASSAGTKTSASNRLAHRYPLTLDRAGAVRGNGTLSLHVTGIGGASATRATIDFMEIR